MNRHRPKRRRGSTSPPPSCYGCAPTSPDRRGWTTGRDRTRSIITASPGLEEYRQIHLAETNPGLWPATTGVETHIPAERHVDGIAEVTFQSVLSPLRGRQADPAGVQGRGQRVPPHPALRRSAEHVPLVRGGRPGDTVGARAVVYLRRKDGVGARDFRTLITQELVPALAATGGLTELRTQTFLPWNRRPGTPRTSPTTTRPTSGTTHHSSSGSPTRRSGRTSSRQGDREPVEHAGPAHFGHPRLRRLRDADLRQERHDPPALSAVVRQGESVAVRSPFRAYRRSTWFEGHRRSFPQATW